MRAYCYGVIPGRSAGPNPESRSSLRDAPE
jgi:hypothetical protein